MAGLIASAGCATHIKLASTQREAISAQARALAGAARNFQEMVHSHTAALLIQMRAEKSSQVTRDAVYTQNDTVFKTTAFRAAAETFARESAAWPSEEAVSTRYEQLIEAWVKMQKTLGALQANQAMVESYQRCVHEWEQLASATGNAGKKYQENLEGPPPAGQRRP